MGLSVQGDPDKNMATPGTQRTCTNGHKYYKSSDCPVCPVCAAADRAEDGFLAGLSGPARSALQAAGITTLGQLSRYSEKEILKLHGMGKKTIPILKQSLSDAGLDFRNPSDHAGEDL